VRLKAAAWAFEQFAVITVGCVQSLTFDGVLPVEG
jgi:hypothetical protein